MRRAAHSKANAQANVVTGHTGPNGRRPRSLRLSRLSRVGRTGVLALLLALVPGVAGCSLFAAMAYKMSPEVTVPARYAPKKEPMVVIVQRSRNQGDAVHEAERIGRYVTEDLKAHKIGPMLDPAELTDLQPRRTGGSVWAAARPAAPAARPMTLTEMGRAVGARQILYVDLTTFAIEPALGSEMVNGQAEARVRVIDAETGKTRWPTDTTQGHLISLSTPFAATAGGGGETAVREHMTQALAARIARLFYSWDSDQVDKGSPVE